MQKLMIAALLIGIASAASAQAEDAEHRADRLRTIELNRRAQAVVDRRDRANARVRRGGDDADDRYERQLAAWRRQVAACNDGDYRACQSPQ